MKSQERQTLKELPAEELKVRLKECEEKLFRLSFLRLSVPVKNSLEIRGLKKFRARLLTWLREKEIQKAGAPR